MKNILLLFFGLFLNFILFSQTSDLSFYNNLILEDDFNSLTSLFSAVHDQHNQISINEGELILNRVHANSDFITLAKRPIILNDYKIKTAFKIEPSEHQKSYTGIILNMPKDHNQSIAIELNSNLEYRFRKLLPTSSEFISGSASNFGWVKHKSIHKNGTYNQIELISNRGSYEIFINGQYINSFKVSGPDFGEFGFIIGPNSKASIDFLSVYGPSSENIKNQLNANTIVKSTKPITNIASSQNIKQNINTSNKEIELLKKQLSESKQHLKKEQENNKMLQSELKNMKTNFMDFKKGYIEMESNNVKLSNEVKQLQKLDKDRQSLQKEYQWTSELLDKSNLELIKVKKELKTYKKQSQSTIDLNKEITSLNKTVQKQKLLLDQKEKELSSINTKYLKKINDEKAINESLSKYVNSNLNHEKTTIIERTKQQLESNKSKIDELNAKCNSLKNHNIELHNDNKILKAQIEAQKKISSQFAESFSLEKEKNKQYQNEIMSFYMENEPAEKKDSVVYRVQLGIFDDNIDIEGLEDLTTIYTNAQQIIYISGKFKDFKTAKNYLVKMRKKGFQDAFIVKF